MIYCIGAKDDLAGFIYVASTLYGVEVQTTEFGGLLTFLARPKGDSGPAWAQIQSKEPELDNDGLNAIFGTLVNYVDREKNSRLGTEH